MKLDEIEKLDYSSIVGLLNERNRPSGGIKTVQEVCVNTFLNRNSYVLEIGSNTGFTSVNINLLSGSNVTGIDININSIKKAEEYAKQNNVNAEFLQTSATQLPFKDDSFDLVWASNVTSFISEKESAIKEYSRVLKYKGYLVVIPIYYIKTPPTEIINEISSAINSEVGIWDMSYWLDLVEKSFKKSEEKFELVYSSDYSYEDQEERLQDFVSAIFEDSGLTSFSAQEIEALKIRYSYFMNLFNENLKYCGYSILIFQKRKIKDQAELFLTKKV